MADELAEKVKAWVAASGFSLELAAASELRRNGFDVVQAEFFADPETRELREIDISAALDISTNKGKVILQLAIECKVSMEHPWVLFTAPTRLPSTISVKCRAASSRGHNLLLIMSEWETVRELPYFRLPARLGYSLTTASLTKGTAKDLAYEALLSAAKASLGVVGKFERTARETAVIALPLVVLRGRLFEVALDEPGDDVGVSEVQQGLLVWRNPLVSEYSLITVVTEAGLPKLAQDYHKAWPDFVNSLRHAIQDIP